LASKVITASRKQFPISAEYLEVSSAFGKWKILPGRETGYLYCDYQKFLQSLLENSWDKGEVVPMLN
jgi:hypothetical protein